MKSIVIGTAGHIDHGKSALVRALTGTDPDRLKEEKARGITIDLGFAHARLGDCDVAFVDVPGHERFVKNMLAGVGGIDAVMLVIAADESVMPQTREHFAICRLLQVRAGLVVLTKTDLVDRDTLELARVEARELVAGSMLEDAPILAVSARTGAGLDDLRQALVRVATGAPSRSEAGPVRLPIDRVFSMRGFGTVVTGTLTSGVIRVDRELVVLPQNRRVKVRGVQVHGIAQATAGAGRRVAVNVGGVEVPDLRRGDTLAEAGAFEPTRRFDAMLQLLPDARPLKHGARVRFHHGTSELLGRVAFAARTTSPGAIAELLPGDSAYARIRLEASAVLTRGDRFILRAYSPSITIGGGRVLDPLPATTRIRSAASASRFASLSAGDPQAVLAFVYERGAAGLDMPSLARRAGLTIDRVREIALGLCSAGRARLVGETAFSAPLVRQLEEDLTSLIADHHRRHPLSGGLPREEARERMFGRAAPALFEDVLARLAAAGKIVARERLTIPGQGATLSIEEEAARAALEAIYKNAGLAPPDLVTAAHTAGIAPALADRVSGLLLREKTLVRIETILFHAAALAHLKHEVGSLKSEQAGGRIDVARFKERYGISRKYAIPLLEWLDRERVTRRVGDARVIL